VERLQRLGPLTDVPMVGVGCAVLPQLALAYEGFAESLPVFLLGNVCSPVLACAHNHPQQSTQVA
jgi:hypothetical protein